MMKKILVPTDFSSCAENALVHAIKLAELTNSELTMLHAVPVPSITSGDQTYRRYLELKQEWERAAEQEMQDLLIKFPRLRNVEYRTLIRLGHAPDVILSYSDHEGIDLIVMGTLGRKGPYINPILLENITTSIIRLSSCPVLAIPDNSMEKDVKRIALAYDEKELLSENNLKELLTLVDLFNAEVDVVVVNSKDRSKVNDHQLNQYLSKVPHTFHYLFNANVEEAIRSFVITEKVDLLVVFPHQHSMIEFQFKGSTTQNIALDGTIPLLTFHD